MVERQVDIAVRRHLRRIVGFVPRHSTGQKVSRVERLRHRRLRGRHDDFHVGRQAMHGDRRTVTLIDAQTKSRILPAYYSDNYISLLPGESRTIEIEYPGTAGHNAALTLRGWNAVPQIIAVK